MQIPFIRCGVFIRILTFCLLLTDCYYLGRWPLVSFECEMLDAYLAFGCS